MKLNPTLSLLALFGMACNSHPDMGAAVDTPTSGTIIIAADEALQPIVAAQIAAFEGIYAQAHIEAHYMPEQKVLQYMLADSAVLAIVSRKLVEEEKNQLLARKIWPSETKVAGDALAVIVNPVNPDSVFTMDQLRSMLQGKLQDWHQLNPASTLGKMQLVFDHAHSGSVRVLQDSVAGGQRLPPYCFAVNSNPEVVAYVAANPAAIGIIGVSWVSDSDDNMSQQFTEEVQVAGLFSPQQGEYLKPYQAYLAQKLYPLQRDVYLLSREAGAGLGSGFVSFVASERGQRIILKAGLVPATMPLRIVQFSEDARDLDLSSAQD